MSNTVGEIAKFFLTKSWVVFALSLIAGFFAAILIPSEWRNSIPLENNDLRAIVSFVVAWAIFYVIFSGIRGLMKLATDKVKSNNLKKQNDEYQARRNREEIKDYRNYDSEVLISRFQRACTRAKRKEIRRHYRRGSLFDFRQGYVSRTEYSLRE